MSQVVLRSRKFELEKLSVRTCVGGRGHDTGTRSYRRKTSMAIHDVSREHPFSHDRFGPNYLGMWLRRLSEEVSERCRLPEGEPTMI